MVDVNRTELCPATKHDYDLPPPTYIVVQRSSFIVQPSLTMTEDRLLAGASYWVSTEDWHTGGEPFRIVSELPTHCQTRGSTVAERRFNILNAVDHPLDILRQTLCHEPRGHADMYGGFIIPPDDTGAHFGVLFWHKDGFSTACGHGTIALGHWAIENDIVPHESNGKAVIVIDVPSGRVTAQVFLENGIVKHVDFINVTSYQIADQIPVHMSSFGSTVKVDLAWGGALYAYVDVKSLSLLVEKERHDEFVKLGREVKSALGLVARHQGHDLYGVCFYQHLAEDDAAITQKNVVVFADGQIDRSPCGSGTAARVAILLALGRLPGLKRLKHLSIVDTIFEAVIERTVPSPTAYPACIPRITGRANLTGRHRFFIDPKDPLYPGFVFR